MSTRLFISKNISELGQLQTFLANKNTELIAHSFLHFEGIDFELESTYDIIFFTSPRSVIFFKAIYEIPGKVKIACTGSKTAELLQTLGYRVDFTGTKSGDIQSVAKEFKAWSGGQKVLFPISTKSLKTISSELEESTVIEVEVYETKIQGKAIEDCDTYVFTSPSNVEGFIIDNAIPSSSRIIAWGTSTADSLEQNGFHVNHVLNDSSIPSLIALLN